jgi:rhodanese-related sulfurtransferase
MLARITPRQLYDRIAGGPVPCVVDVRREPAFAGDDRMLPGAIRRPPPDEIARDLPRGRPLIVYCVHGHEVSQNTAAALAAAGWDACYLEGGIEAWKAAGLPTRRKLPAAKWVTRARPKVDRIACPWLVRRFIDAEAEILYVPADDVAAAAERTGAIPFDVPGAAFGHHGEKCSFDAFLERFELKDAALDRLAMVVRGADTGRPDLAPEAAGLLAVSQGLSATIEDDLAMLDYGMTLYDALYAWCRR